MQVGFNICYYHSHGLPFVLNGCETLIVTVKEQSVQERVLNTTFVPRRSEATKIGENCIYNGESHNLYSQNIIKLR
jgi:hypothetical protein